MSISVHNVSKYYGSQKALDTVTFEVAPGEIVGFLGPNGAGKSTMMKIICGYIPQSEGSVSVCDLDVIENEIEAKRKLGYLPENNPLYLDMYVKEYLEFAGGIFKIENLRQRIDEMIDKVGLDREKHKKIGALSKGYRQRVGLAQAFLHDPEVLILDEPTTGLDPNQIQEIRALIKEIGANKTILLSTHIMQEVEAICDRAIIIHEGKIVADKQIELLKKSNLVNNSLLVQFTKEIDTDELTTTFPGVKIKVLSDRKIEISGGNMAKIKKEIMQFALNQEIEIQNLTEATSNLEDIFKHLTIKEGQ